MATLTSTERNPLLANFAMASSTLWKSFSNSLERSQSATTYIHFFCGHFFSW